MSFLSKRIVFGFISVFAVTLMSRAAYSAGRNLVLLSGGHGSCYFAGDPSSTPLWPNLQSALPRGQEHYVVRSCFALGKETVFVDVVRIDQNQNEQTLMSTVQTSYLEAPKKLAELVQKIKPDRISLIGQSYGGWMVMAVARHLSKIDLLVTIDPISVLDCDISDAIGSILGDTSSGCRRFPRDFSSLQAVIAKKTKIWRHYYQNQFEAIRSGPSSAATSSTLLDFDDFILHPFGAHYATESDSRIWRRVASELMRLR